MHDEQAILDAFLALTESLSKLSHKIREEDNLVAWVQPDSQPALNVSPREKATAIFNQLYYEAKQLPREIILCAGFIGASNETLELAQEVNRCKDLFKQHILALKSSKRSANDPRLLSQFSEIIMRSPSTASALNRSGLSRLHLKQCYRKIPILSMNPSKISWTWAHTRSIKKISLSTAQAMLLKRGNDQGIQIQLQKLGTLSPNESLAIVQELAPHLRANVVFSKSEVVQRMMIKGPVPILFPADPTTPYPQYVAPRDKQEKDLERMTRSDVKLDPFVFLPAIRAHRYLR